MAIGHTAKENTHEKNTRLYHFINPTYITAETAYIELLLSYCRYREHMHNIF